MRKYYWNPFLRFPALSLVVIALLTIPFLLRMAEFEITSETRLLLEGDQRNLSSYEKVKEILADVEVLVVSLECDDVFTVDGIDAIRRVSEAFTPRPAVVDVKSLTHSSKPVRRGFSFEMIPLVPTGIVSSNELAALKEFSLQHPLIRDVMVASDSKHTLITVTYEREFDTAARQAALREEIDEILAPFRNEGLRFEFIAVPLIEDEIRSSLKADAMKFLPAALALVTGILWAVFRSLKTLLLVFANQAAAIVVLPGLIQASGYALSVFTILVFPLITGIHLALLIHVFTAFERARPGAASAGEAIARMLREVSKPCVFAAITTGIGLLSLTLSEVRQVREFGILGALGIALIFFMTFGPGLSVLKIAHARAFGSREPSSRLDSHSFDSRAISAGSKHLASDVWQLPAIRGFVIQRPLLIIMVAVAFTILSGIGIQRIRTDIRAVEFLNPESSTRHAVEEFDRIYGGINVVQLDLDSGATNGINDLSYLNHVDSIQSYAESQPGVSGVYSYSQLLAMINQIWEGGRTDALKLPDNVWLINLFALALKAQNFPFLTALADSSFRTSHIVIRTPDMPSDQYLSIVNDITDFAERNKPENVSISASGGVHSILEADRRILRSQQNSALTTLLVVAIVLSLLWRSPLLAFLTLLANAVPVAFVVALAGYLDVPLNSITVMVAAITLGVAVDDAIHFITHWRDARSAGATSAEAIHEAFRVKAKPIISTSLILIAILTIFWLSSFPPVVHFGILSAGAFAGALIGTLLLLPAMLSLFPSRVPNHDKAHPRKLS